MTEIHHKAVQKANKQGFNLSEFVRKQLDKFFDDNPEYIKDRLSEVNNDIQEMQK